MVSNENVSLSAVYISMLKNTHNRWNKERCIYLGNTYVPREEVFTVDIKPGSISVDTCAER